jgi:hypothetical protein|tara:strand:- start:1169 stop:1795 length:627 start_codon:yes stop_codon:yes gene_type:complete
VSVSLKKFQLPTLDKLNHIKIDLAKLRAQSNQLSEQFVDVKTANPMLCENHVKLVKDVYDNFEQINLTTPSEILPYTASVKERLKRKEEHLYNVPTKEYLGSYIESIIEQTKAPASRIRITKLAAGKTIPFHVDYDVSYAVRCIVPIYGDSNVINLFKRNNQIEAYNMENGSAYFLNIAYPHAVVNMSDQPRIALMFSLDGQDDLEDM